MKQHLHQFVLSDLTSAWIASRKKNGCYIWCIDPDPKGNECFWICLFGNCTESHNLVCPESQPTNQGIEQKKKKKKNIQCPTRPMPRPLQTLQHHKVIKSKQQQQQQHSKNTLTTNQQPPPTTHHHNKNKNKKKKTAKKKKKNKKVMMMMMMMLFSRKVQCFLVLRVAAIALTARQTIRCLKTIWGFTWKYQYLWQRFSMSKISIARARLYIPHSDQFWHLHLRQAFSACLIWSALPFPYKCFPAVLALPPTGSDRNAPIISCS